MEELMKSLLTVLWSLLDDFRRLQPGVKGLDRDYVTVKARIKNEGYGFVSISLSSFLKAFDQGLEAGVLPSIPGYSRKSGTSLPKFLSGLTGLVFDATTGSLLEKPDVHAVKCLREFLGLFKQLSFSDSLSKKHDKEAKEKFLATEELISDVELEFYEAKVSQVILSSLSDFDLLTGKHGPGAVEEKISSNQKWLELSRGIYDRDASIMDLGYDLESFLRNSSSFSSRLPVSETVRLVTVPKNVNSRRTITIEPCVKQFAQQALNSHIRRHILMCPVLSNCLTLHDQSKNQTLALQSSQNRLYSTIDLSSASDLLSYSIVKKVFRNHPRFLTLLDNSRTPAYGDNTLLRKFAGMGNATTFPVQSVVFAVIAIASVLAARRLSPTYRNIVACSRSVRVYGDDIIVPTYAYTSAVSRLTLYGLKVNEGKSFSRGNFRESCGAHCFMGFDVKPLYIEHAPSKPLSPEGIANYIAVSNQAWLKGLYRFATALRNIVEENLRKVLPLVKPEFSGLGWIDRFGSFSIERWDRKLQKFMVKSFTTQQVYRNDKLDGYPALLKFFHTPLIGRAERHLERSVRRHSNVLRLRWVHV